MNLDELNTLFFNHIYHHHKLCQFYSNTNSLDSNLTPNLHCIFRPVPIIWNADYKNHNNAIK